MSLANMFGLCYNYTSSNRINSRGATGIAHGLSNSIGGAITMSDHTPNQRQPQNIPYGYCHCGCGQLAPIAKRTYSCLGHKKGEPIRFIVGHNNYIKELRPVAERFWEKVDKRGPDDCWEWQGSLNQAGYGQLTVDRAHQLAHRIGYELEHGKIPDGSHLLHKCDNRPCCNPRHLQPGTRSDNMQDMVSKNRHNPARAYGEANPASKISDEQVYEILRRCANGETQAALAREMGIGDSQVSRIVRGMSRDGSRTRGVGE